MSFQDEAERIQAMAASMAIQLHALFPDGYSPEDADQRKQIQECFHNLVDPHGPNFQPEVGPIHDSNHLKKAIPIAVQQWKELQVNASKVTQAQPKSFSLLDQWTSGGFSLPTFTVAEILELPTIPAQLQRLQEIQYLEDVLGNWNDVKQLLLSGLEYNPSMDSSSEPDKVSTGSIPMEFLQLHRKWFHEARSSQEYLKVQYDLILNLTKSLRNQGLPSPSSSCSSLDIRQEEQWCFDRLRNWHDMLVDLMERDEYVMEEMNEIELFLLDCLGSESMTGPLTSRNDPNNDTHDKSRSLSCLEMLAVLDPSAHGFGLWIHHVSLSSLQSLLEQTPQALSLVWNCCCSCQFEDNKIMTLRKWYCMSVLRFLLNKLRVVLFPWQQLLLSIGITMSSADARHGGNERTGDVKVTSTAMTEMTTSELQYQVLDLFVEGAINLISDDDDKDGHSSWRRDLCYSAMETMIGGLATVDLVDVKQQLSPVEQRSTLVWDHLQTILIQVERHG